MEADYIIVGAGSAGCAIAYRLAEAGESVLVIEHGGTDMGPLIQMPAALSYPMNMKMYDWGYESEPEPHLEGRRLACPSEALAQTHTPNHTSSCSSGMTAQQASGSTALYLCRHVQ